jgi:hypothetical protein
MAMTCSTLRRLLARAAEAELLTFRFWIRTSTSFAHSKRLRAVRQSLIIYEYMQRLRLPDDTCRYTISLRQSRRPTLAWLSCGYPGTRKSKFSIILPFSLTSTLYTYKHARIIGNAVMSNRWYRWYLDEPSRHDTPSREWL